MNWEQLVAAGGLIGATLGGLYLAIRKQIQTNVTKKLIGDGNGNPGITEMVREVSTVVSKLAVSVAVITERIEQHDLVAIERRREMMGKLDTISERCTEHACSIRELEVRFGEQDGRLDRQLGRINDIQQQVNTGKK